MGIERKKFETKREFELITGMIVSDAFIKEIIPVFSPKYLSSSPAKTVARWCMEYFAKYQSAPKETIQDLFKSKTREGQLEEADVEIIEKYLDNLSRKYETLTDDNYNHQSATFLSEKNLMMLTEDIRTAITSGKVTEAEAAVAKYARLSRASTSSIDIIKDRERIIDILNSEDDILLKLPGALGDMIGPLSRGDFLAIIAPMKRGKTHWLLEFALRGLYRNLKVLFVSCEMTEKAMLRRTYQSIMAQPKRPQEVIIPYFDENGFVATREVPKEGIKAKTILKKAEAMTTFLQTGGGFRLLCRPSNTMSVSDLRMELHNLAYYDDFVPDIIVGDYADIFAPEKGGSKEYRHGIDETWKSMRALAQELNCLFITASQSTREGFNKDIDEKGVAEDIRKLAHVTHAMVLNQDKEQKKNQIMRAGMLVSRNEEFHTANEVACLYNYAIGKPFLSSRWVKDVNI